MTTISDLIKAKWQTPPSGKKRKVYSITAAGRKTLRARLEEWARFTQSVSAILKEYGDD